MATVLVTGARGNVGREVARACTERGFTVRAADRAAATRFDFLDRGTWSAALAGCEFVFLLRPPPIGDMEATLCPFVDAAYAAGVRHIVFLSVAGADRMKWVPHRKVEQHLAARGDAWTVLRPGFFAQNLGDAYLRDIVEDDRIYVPAGGGRVAFVDVYDVGDVAARVFEAPEQFRARALTLTGPKAITFEDAAREVSSAVGREVRYVPASVPGYAWHLRRARNMPWKQIAIQTALHVGLRRGDAELVDPTLGQVLGRPPRTVHDYVVESAQMWRARSR